jgi:four helix bundle protein
MTSAQMMTRTRRFAVDVIRFCMSLPKTEEGRIIARQLMRSASSVGANYRAAQRGRSKSEFIAKLGIVIEEADETPYWLEVLADLERGDADERQRLHHEADELVRIVVSAVKSATRTT